MLKEEFEKGLDGISLILTDEAKKQLFTDAKRFETRVREVAEQVFGKGLIDFEPAAQAFPDIAIGDFGIEVKFSLNDTWRSVANSVLETNRIDEVKHVYVLFGKMGGEPEVKWNPYEKCVMHVRTSHVPRFEVEIDSQETLFDVMGIKYDDFRILQMHQKMSYIRTYAKSRLKDGERLWWLEDAPGREHTLPIQARLYTKLTQDEKTRLRAEAVLLCPQVVDSGRARNKYDDVVLFLLTYHGVLCHQARDLFSAGSVANPTNDDNGGVYIQRAISLIEEDIRKAAVRLDSTLFEEYWGRSVEPAERIREWLRRADTYARGWVPSETLFLQNRE